MRLCCRGWLPDIYHHRSILVNSYPAVCVQQPRLDFSYYEYPDISRFEEVRLDPCPFLIARKNRAVGELNQPRLGWVPRDDANQQMIWRNGCQHCTSSVFATVPAKCNARFAQDPRCLYSLLFLGWRPALTWATAALPGCGGSAAVHMGIQARNGLRAERVRLLLCEARGRARQAAGRRLQVLSPAHLCRRV